MHIVMLAAITIILDRHAFVIKPRTDAEHAAPVVHCRLDVAHDITGLADFAKKTTHEDTPNTREGIVMNGATMDEKRKRAQRKPVDIHGMNATRINPITSALM
ncbi:hypothetical protein PTKU64_42630 [Paraburkholderia terrae]|uniref:Secreted protein n=1 Tax=Paraburkholderia terrae TaxID=311230 RepID=A0ABM7TN61_9BURK|nr:hypothetical protein PTKU64_42630 [Paraburkholderia terrae]BDC40943.1 hypothetical protein PTKU15_42400 [Paraburkholderia terrae]